MDSLVSWVSTQSGASLVVAIIALLGVLLTTWWNNFAADKRRRHDQLAEDNRRRVDDARREIHRLESLNREERARQRLVIAEFIREITNASNDITELVSTKIQQGAEETVGNRLLAHVVALQRFYDNAVVMITVLELEVSEPYVSLRVQELKKQLESDYSAFEKARQGGTHVLAQYTSTASPLSTMANRRISILAAAARIALLPIPEGVGNQSIPSIEDEDIQPRTTSNEAD